MSGAIVQGVPMTTLDTDLWIDLPERQYIRLLTLAQKLGGTIIRQTVVALRNGSLVNFLYHVDGVASFSTEWRRAVEIELHGEKVQVLPLERIIRSKEFVGRPKDLAALPVLRDALASKKLLRR